MIDTFLVVEHEGKDVVSQSATFSVMPQVGQAVGFWHQRQHVFAVVQDIFFDQQEDGSFAAIISAELRT